MTRWPPPQPAEAPVGRSGGLGAGSDRRGATSSVTGLGMVAGAGAGAGFMATRVGAGGGAGFVASRAGAGAGAGAGFVASRAGAGAGTGRPRRAGALAGGALGVIAASNLCHSDGSDLVDAAAAPG